MWSGRARCTCRPRVLPCRGMVKGSSLHVSADAVKPDGLEAIQYAMLLAMVFGVME